MRIQLKTKDSRLAREFVVALPIELEKDQWTALLTEYIQTNFVAEGMCADVAIHDTDGHNPHAHIMLTVRPLDEHGKWQYKTAKEYLCVRDGEERGFTATEFKAAQECKYTAELESALQQYRELQAQATGFDAEELTDARLQLRPGMDRSTVARIQAAYESQYSPFTMAEARRDVSNMLGEYEEEPRSVRERLRNHQQEQTAPRKKEKDRDR